ncbi:UNVERIFIED_CONTAM: hypothetical protein GTU68_056447 [Idotea baltica]|nr:hypothetical protein [Idotea baltica]
MESAEEACDRLCDPDIEVSAHYVLGKNGELAQLVDEKERAWHAGASYWMGCEDLNSASIGIEIDNNGARPFEDEQYTVLIKLIQDISRRWEIAPTAVLGHQDIAIGRKFDPGPWFDWARLDAAGVSSPPRAQVYREKTEQGFREMAHSAGYDGNADLADLLMNVRMRHGATPYFGELRETDFGSQQASF